MASWFDKGRPAIFEALSTVCQQIDHDLRAELQYRDLQPGNGPAASDQELLQKQESELSSLRDENATLKVQLAQAKSQKRPEPGRGGWSRASDDMSTPARSKAAPSSENAHDWRVEFGRLSAKFNALSDNFKLAKEALRKRKDERDQWIQHVDLLERKVRAAEHEHGIQILERSSRTPRISKPESPSDAHDNRVQGTDVSSEGDKIIGPLVSVVPEQTLSNTGQVSGDNIPTESTQAESEGRPEDLPDLPADEEHTDVQVKCEPSSDSPVLVSERVLKKRKRAESDQDTAAVRRVKVEVGEDSSPLVSLDHYSFNPHESLDLGSVARTMLTPRKPKESAVLDTPAQIWEDHQHSPTAVRAPVEVQQTPGPRPERHAVFTSALAPLDGNRLLVRPPRETPQIKPLTAGLAHGISDVAEDGAVYEIRTSLTDIGAPKSINPAVQGRLNNLLNSPYSENAATVPQSARRARDSPRTPRDDLPLPKPRELPFERSGRQGGKRTNTPTNATLRPNAPRLTPSETKAAPQRPRSPQHALKGSSSLLRNRPLVQLRLDDFRVNPQRNEGHDFAFTEVVRNQGDRSCLDGCINPECCGEKWKGFARSQRPKSPLTTADRQEEQRLLEEYLGDWSYRLTAMDKGERVELWVEAKAQELANKYGKHRQRFSRMRSPPGFWNADFPSTQELEAEKTEAAKRERQAVLERYREAMRPGGRWLFRDE